jgi:hypothetical protein
MIYQETLTARWHDTDATLAVRPSQEWATCRWYKCNENENSGGKT